VSAAAKQSSIIAVSRPEIEASLYRASSRSARATQKNAVSKKKKKKKKQMKKENERKEQNIDKARCGGTHL
jgi:hypothetical protein